MFHLKGSLLGLATLLAAGTASLATSSNLAAAHELAAANKALHDTHTTVAAALGNAANSLGDAFVLSGSASALAALSTQAVETALLALASALLALGRGAGLAQLATQLSAHATSTLGVLLVTGCNTARKTSNTLGGASVHGLACSTTSAHATVASGAGLERGLERDPLLGGGGGGGSRHFHIRLGGTKGRKQEQESQNSLHIKFLERGKRRGGGKKNI